MRRHAVGLIAIVLLSLAVYFWIWPPTGPAGQELQAAFGRIGVVMVVIWLAYDQLKRVPGWLLWTLPVMLVALAWRPKWLLVLIPALIVLAILRPRPRPRRP
jgi:hypothetical protein